MKCPKCGRENWQTIYEVKPELSNAEKLFWLVENKKNIRICFLEKEMQWEITLWEKDFTGIKITENTFEIALNIAYDWAAKEQK